MGASGRGGVGGKGERKGQKIGTRVKSKTQILDGQLALGSELLLRQTDVSHITSYAVS